LIVIDLFQTASEDLLSQCRSCPGLAVSFVYLSWMSERETRTSWEWRVSEDRELCSRSEQRATRESSSMSANRHYFVERNGSENSGPCVYPPLQRDEGSLVA
jgi:hypothetical protein